MSKNGVKTALRLLFYELWAIICFSKNQNRIYYCNIEKSLFYQWNGFTIVFMNQKSDTNWKNTLLSFLPINVIFSLKCACISSTILTFLPYIPVRFYYKNSQKVNYSSKCDYNTGHYIDFSYEKSDSSSKCACIWSTILTFLPNNPLCFYTKNSQKVHFSSNCAYITGHLLTFLPNNVIFSSKCASKSSIILTLYPNNPVYFIAKISKKITFTLISTIIQGTLLNFRPKIMIISSKCTCILSTILTFLPNNTVCFYNRNS